MGSTPTVGSMIDKTTGKERVGPFLTPARKKVLAEMLKDLKPYKVDPKLRP